MSGGMEDSAKFHKEKKEEGKLNINTDLNALFKEDDVNEVLADLYEVQSKIKYLVVIYQNDDDDVTVMMSAPTQIPYANILIDQAKDVILHGEIIEKDDSVDD